jgi:hypothetical protein
MAHTANKLSVDPLLPKVNLAWKGQTLDLGPLYTRNQTMKVWVQTIPYWTHYWTWQVIKIIICIMVLTPSLKALGPIVSPLWMKLRSLGWYIYLLFTHCTSFFSSRAQPPCFIEDGLSKAQGASSVDFYNGHATCCSFIPPFHVGCGGAHCIEEICS